MIVSIIGSPKRAAAWEAHLLPHRMVREVIIAPELESIDETDACIIIDDSPNNLYSVQNAVKKGYHTYLVASLPNNKEELLKTARYAEESGVVVQLTHWPTLSQCGRWMMNRLPKPTFLSFNKTMEATEFNKHQHILRDVWIDELAFCLRWIDTGIRRLDAHQIKPEGQPARLFHLFIRFNNSATATIHINTMGDHNHHNRVASNNKLLMDCNVAEQTIRTALLSQSGKIPTFEHITFDPARSAEMAITQFLKSIQQKKPALYNAHHAWELCKVIERVENRLRRMA